MSRKVIEFDKTKRILASVATCVEATSRSLCLSKSDTIQYLKEKSLIIEGQTKYTRQSNYSRDYYEQPHWLNK